MTIREQVTNIATNKKVRVAVTIILLMAIIFFSVSIRVQNLPLLKDTTTGEYIPLALDPFYFTRIAETLEANNGTLPDVDTMRNPSAQVPYTSEILPQVMYLMSKTMGIDLHYMVVLSPVIFFALSMIVFFLLVLVLTNSKAIAIISCAFLSFSPAYLYRTMAGFADHESLGMLCFFVAMLVYVYALKSLAKEHDYSFNIWTDSIFYGGIVGVVTAFTLFSWMGIGKYLLIMFPLTFLIIWLLRRQQNKPLLAYGIFYITWFITLFISLAVGGSTFSSALSRLVLGSSVLTGAVLLFILVEGLLNRFAPVDAIGNRSNSPLIVSIVLSAFFGISFVWIIGTNSIDMLSRLFFQVTTPLGGRIGLTVAENARPNINQVVAAFQGIFWYFYLGCLVIGWAISQGLKNIRNTRILFFALWALMVSFVLFMETAIWTYAGMGIFAGYCIFLFVKERIDTLYPESILISVWMILMLLSLKGAIRLHFLTTPFICFMVAVLIWRVFRFVCNNYESNGGEKILLVIGIGGIILLGGGALYTSWEVSNAQAQGMGPSANAQWQGAMSWVRDNTPQESIFVGWWDYFYWVQTLGERASLTDGGHAIPYWDHLIGRYLLTNPDSVSAMSFMKSHNVSYLLIDQSDIGKYPAYSKIGSGEKGVDRFGQIPTLLHDEARTQETKDERTEVFLGGSYLLEDIIYNGTLFPANKAGVVGILLPFSQDSTPYLKQPQAIFTMNNQQYNVPIRYVYLNNQLIDFETGMDVAIRIVPRLSSNAEGQFNIDNIGSILFLAPSVKNSLFAQLFLLNNAENKYPTITPAHYEDNQIIKGLQSSGTPYTDHLIYYQGVHGPIAIYQVEYDSSVTTHQEYHSHEGDYAEFDYLMYGGYK